MSEDRVDPLGGWFNTGDRKIDELPSLEASRSTQPRSSESLGMQPRGGVETEYRYNAIGLVPSIAVNNGLTALNQGWVSCVGASCIALLFAPIILPIGATIVGGSIGAFIQTPGPNESVALTFQEFADDGTATLGTSFPSSSNGAWKVDSQGVVPMVIQANHNYLMYALLRNTAGVSFNDVKISFVGAKVFLPG